MTGSVAPKRVVPTLTEVVEPADLAFLLDLDLDLPPRPRARAAEAGVAESPQLAAVPVLPELPDLPELTLAVDSVPDLSDPLEGEFLRPLAQELPAALDLTLPELNVAEQSAAPFNLPESSVTAPSTVTDTAPDTPDLDLAFDLAGPEVPAPAPELESALALAHPAPTPTPVFPQALAPVQPLPANAPSTVAEPLRTAFAGHEQAIKEAIALAVDEALDQVLDEVLEQAVMTMRAQLHAHVESAVWRSLKRQLPQG